VTDEHGRRIPIVDKRVAHQKESAPGTPTGHESAPTGPGASPSGLGADGPYGTASTPSALEGDTVPPPQAQEVTEDPQTDFLDDLKRLQADFDNYRKRMMREQAATAGRAKARLMEQMLPVLDAFDQALEHDDGSSGMELIYKQLKATLEAEGLEEIPAEGVPFDPHVHDAVDSREDPAVSEIVTRSVYRRGYRVGDQVLRAAMVVVARPPEVAPAEVVAVDDATEAVEG
jgi:molecular chaperone GrpE (heat shock protein)